MKYYQLFCIFVFWAICVGAQTPVNEWKGIVPLQSTKADFEKLAGQPTRSEINLYETDKEKIVIWLSKGTCKENRESNWDVPKDTIIGMLVSPKVGLKVSEFLKEPVQFYERHADPKMSGVFVYQNKDGSVRFETRMLASGIEDITFIAFAPTLADTHLRCGQTKRDKQTSFTLSCSKKNGVKSHPVLFAMSRW